jgi:hypothetical protein
MIRPVTNEENLQNLEQMDEDMFRSDFLEQVDILRRKVVSCVKPKKLNGKHLSPEMFANLAENYVHAINEGAVPNIENAWTYICQNESNKSMEKALCHFDNYVEEEIVHYLPMEECDLREHYKDVREQCKKLYVQSCMGETIEEDYNTLKNSIEDKFKSLLMSNEKM